MINNNHVNALVRTLNFKVPTIDVKDEMVRRARTLAKTAKIQGFRPGKAPVDAVSHIYQGQIHYDALNYVTYMTFISALEQQDAAMVVAGDPSFEEVLGESNEENVSFKATFEIYPQIDLTKLDSLNVERPESDVSEKDVELTIDIIRQQRRVFKLVDIAAKNQDRVTIDFVGRLDGVAFKGGTANNYQIILGQGSMLPDFEKAILGNTAGATIRADVTFPETYHSQDMAGKTAQFEITIQSVEESELPPMDEFFVKEFGIDSGSVEELKAEILTNLTLETKKRIERLKKMKVLNALQEQMIFPVPMTLIKKEAEKLMQDAKQKYQVRKWEEKNFNQEQFYKAAEERMRLGLILNALMQEKKFKVEHFEVVAKIKEFSVEMDQPEDFVKIAVKNKEVFNRFQDEIMESKLVEFVLSKAQVTAKKMGFEELVREDSKSGTQTA